MVPALRKNSIASDSTMITASSAMPSPAPMREKAEGTMADTIIMLSVTMLVTSAARITRPGS